MDVICQDCGATSRFCASQYICTCGGVWEPNETIPFNYTDIDISKPGLWRYLQNFALNEVVDPFTLGAGWTPLVDIHCHGHQTFFKLEFMAPTGSFKDRGTEVEINLLKRTGVKKVVEDSSGNAGASMAAYAARAGIQAEIFVPKNASPAKSAQLEVFGARLHKIPGPRQEAARAALKAAANGAIYASHAYNPAYLLGQQSFAWEIWEQMDRSAPEAVVIPVGYGGLLMGAWLGFRKLLNAGLINKLPSLFAIQPKLLSPVAKAMENGLLDVPAAVSKESSLAEGLAIKKPVRGRRILQALRESGGGALTVSEDAIRNACKSLAHCGLFVEPSSAVAFAALPQVYHQVGGDAQVVVALTGSGLKSALDE